MLASVNGVDETNSKQALTLQAVLCGALIAFGATGNATNFEGAAFEAVWITVVVLYVYVLSVSLMGPSRRRTASCGATRVTGGCSAERTAAMLRASQPAGRLVSPGRQLVSRR